MKWKNHQYNVKRFKWALLLLFIKFWNKWSDNCKCIDIYVYTLYSIYAIISRSADNNFKKKDKIIVSIKTCPNIKEIKTLKIAMHKDSHN